MVDKVLKQLRIVFVLSLVFAVVSLSADILYSLRINPVENVALERWGIIITLFGIFGSLKLLHPKLNKEEKMNKQEALKKYAMKYCLRLSALLLIFLFNLVSLHITGVENFIFLGIITIFAMLFCVPSKENIESETQVYEDQL